MAQGQYHCASNIISNSHPFHSKWVNPPIPEIQQFQYFTMKIQGQGHGWGQSLKSQCKCNILSTRIPFVPCQGALPFLRYSIFKIWPWKSKVNVIPEGHIVGTTPYQLISLSFDVDEPSHSYLLLLQKFDHENPRSRSWLRWTLKVTPWVQNSIDAHPFRSMSICHPIPEIQFFFKFDLENPRSWSWLRSKWKLKSGCNILPTHMPFVPCQSAIPFLRYSIFKIWPWKSKAKVMGEVNVESHNMCPTLYRLTSLLFHVNLPSHSWDTTFSKFDLENPRSRSWLRSKLKVTKWV